MNKEIKKLDSLIYSFSKETQIMDNILPDLYKNSKVLNKLLAKLGLYKIKNNFSYFNLTLLERQKAFHLCNKINYYIRNIINLLTRLNKRYRNDDIMEEIFNILMICFNKSEEIKKITICVLDKYGFKQRSDNKINNIDSKIIEFDLTKVLEDDSTTENFDRDNDKNIDNNIENNINNNIDKSIDKNINKENNVMNEDDDEEYSFLENNNEKDNNNGNKIEKDMDKDIDNLCSEINKLNSK